MKMAIGNTMVDSLMLHTDSDDATMKASDMQAGVTGYAGGKKITGTGRAFSFAMYGDFSSNAALPVPVTDVNTINIACASHAVKMVDTMDNLRKEDFATAKNVATITVGGTDYAITLQIANSTITLTCTQSVTLQVLFGKDEYV